MQKTSLLKSFLVLLTLVGLNPKVIGAPFQLSYGGRLTDANGQSVQGSVSLELKFFRALSGGNALIEAQKFDNVALEDGVFQVALKALTPSQADTLFAPGSDVFIEVRDLTNGITLPRQQFTAVPYALQAQRVPVDANTLSYGSDGKLRIKGPSNASEAMVLGSDSSGNIAWTQAPASQSNSTTTLSAGSVSRAAIAADAVAARKIDDGAVGSAALAVGAVQLQHFSAMCAPNEILKRDNTGWVCSADNTGAGGTDLSSLSTGIVYKDGASFSQLTIGPGLVNNTGQLQVDFTQAVAQSDGRLIDSRSPSGPAGGQLSGFYPNPTVSLTEPGPIGTTTPSSAKFTNLDALVDLRLKDNDGTNHYVKLKAPATLGADVNYVFPEAPQAGKVLTTNVSGVMSWIPLPAGLSASSVTTTELAGDAVTTAKIAPGAVETTDLADNAVTSNKVNAGAIGSTQLGTDAVNSVKIVDGSIATVDLGDNAVTNLKMADNSIGSAEIVDGAIAADDLGNSSVTTAKINDGAVTVAKLANNACANGQILKSNGAGWDCAADANSDIITQVSGGPGITVSNGTGPIPAIAITAGGVGLNELGLNAVNSTKIVDGSVATADLAPDLLITSSAPGQVPLRVRGQNGQSANAFQILNGGTGNVMLSAMDNGALGIGTDAPLAKIHINETSNMPGIRVNTGPGQTAHIMDFKDNANQTLLSVEPSGAINSKYQGARCTKASASIGGSGTPVLTSSTGMTCPMISNGIVDATSGAVMLKKKGYYRISGKLNWDLPISAGSSYRELNLYTATDQAGVATIQEQNDFRVISQALQNVNNGNFEHQQFHAVIFVDSDNSKYLHLKAAQMSTAPLNINNIEYNIEYLGH